MWNSISFIKKTDLFSFLLNFQRQKLLKIQYLSHHMLWNHLMHTLTHPRLSKGGKRMPLIFITNENIKDTCHNILGSILNLWFEFQFDQYESFLKKPYFTSLFESIKFFKKSLQNEPKKKNQKIQKRKKKHWCACKLNMNPMSINMTIICYLFLFWLLLLGP